LRSRVWPPPKEKHQPDLFDKPKFAKLVPKADIPRRMGVAQQAVAPITARCQPLL
jgi:hypothetical protein